MSAGGKKLSAVAIGTPAGMVLAWTVETVFGITVPAEIGAAFGAICTFIASLAIPDENEE